jgi:hypothetical protein
VAGPTPAELDQLKKDVEHPATGLKALFDKINNPDRGLPVLDVLTRQIADLKKEKDVDRDVLQAKLFAQITAINAQAAKADAQALKVDFSAAKFDEKGLTVFGVTIPGTEKLAASYWVEKLFKKPPPPPPPPPRLAVAGPGDVRAEAARAERLAALLREVERGARSAPAMERALRGVQVQARAAIGDVQRLESGLYRLNNSLS